MRSAGRPCEATSHAWWCAPWGAALWPHRAAHGLPVQPAALSSQLPPPGTWAQVTPRPHGKFSGQVVARSHCLSEVSPFLHFYEPPVPTGQVLPILREPCRAHGCPCQARSGALWPLWWPSHSLSADQCHPGHGVPLAGPPRAPVRVRCTWLGPAPRRGLRASLRRCPWSPLPVEGVPSHHPHQGRHLPREAARLP